MKRLLIVGALTLIVTACQHDFYETGDTGISYLHTDFVEATTNSAAAFTKAVTDDNVSLKLSPALATKWATTADSTYRAMLYYNRVEDGVTTPVAIRSVLTLMPTPLAKAKEKHTHPLNVESIWMSKNKRYLNLSLILKTGKGDDQKAVQSLGLLQTAILTQPLGGRKAYHLTLIHNQAGIPEYYSAKAYASIPLEKYQQGDSLYITVNTYKGTVRKTFEL